MTRQIDPGRALLAAGVLTDLPELFATMRYCRGKSLRTVAREAGCSHSVLARLEGGQLPNGSILISILQWIGGDA